MRQINGKFVPDSGPRAPERRGAAATAGCCGRGSAGREIALSLNARVAPEIAGPQEEREGRDVRRPGHAPVRHHHVAVFWVALAAGYQLGFEGFSILLFAIFVEVVWIDLFSLWQRRQRH
jgi:hypothetical protein